VGLLSPAAISREGDCAFEQTVDNTTINKKSLPLIAPWPYLGLENRFFIMIYILCNLKIEIIICIFNKFLTFFYLLNINFNKIGNKRLKWQEKRYCLIKNKKDLCKFINRKNRSKVRK
jgi:hypothetical protein